MRQSRRQWGWMSGLLCLFAAFNTPEASIAMAAETPGQACASEMQNLQTAAMSVEANQGMIAQVFKTCLREYIRIDTTNADGRPANEGPAVDFLEAVFKALAIPTRRIAVPDLSWRPGQVPRQNLVASLWPDGVAPGTTMPSVLLMHHMDVVGAHPEQWQRVDDSDHPELSGAISRILQDGDDEDMMVGRGAIDMKSVGVMQLIAMALHKYQGTPLKKAVHFLAVADEEQNASGSIGLLREIREGGQLADLAEAKVAFNEGGFGIRGITSPQSQLQVIGTDERGGAWLRLQNDNPQQLLEDLAALKLVPYQSSYILAAREDFWQTIQGWRCRLNRFNTPGAKSNVTPSLVEMELACDNIPSRADIEWAFNTKELFSTLRKVLGCDVFTPGLSIGYQATAWGVKVSVATASSAHGALGSGVSALDVAAWGLQKIGALETPASYRWLPMFEYQFPPSTRATIDALGRLDSQVAIPSLGRVCATGTGTSVRLPKIDNLSRVIDILPASVVTNILYAAGTSSGVEKIFRTSCTWTSLQVPPARKGLSEALLDCRLINTRRVKAGEPGHADEFVAGVQAVLNRNVKRGNKVTRLILDTGWNYTASSIDGPYYKALAQTLQEVFPKAIVAPFMIPGGTDSSYFRDPRNAKATAFPQGLPSYGFIPAMVPVKVIEGFHGSNERFPISQMYPAVLTYHRLLARIAGSEL